ncbi:Uncharacterised protein [Moraxella lacunata]|uniref:Uncharacterized protein n=1 Tax=Moraxella lacunata TaxID=477 RepID=A0A1V4GKP7_MORLA|nr:hypothetical protein [Moraxella lacunata]OPH33194.1 hypothetical protein B5J94_13510 [Moraxella lacunata]STZ00634.1 Uncharacterised protein [Moraxella lacunata]
MAKEDKKDSGRYLDEILKYLLDSHIFEKLILKIRRLWHDPNHTSQTQIQYTSSEPQIIEKPIERTIEVEKIVEKIVTPSWAGKLEQQYQY